MNSKDLKLFILSGRKFSKEFFTEYEAAYKLWDQIWSQTYKEVTGAEEIFSDNFTRQDDVLALFENSVCCALVCHRYINLESSAFLRDSFFKPWSSQDIEKLTSEGKNIVLGSQISIHPDFRRTSLGGKVKEIITFLSLKQLQGQQVDGVAGMMRVDKGMNNLFYNSGAIPISQNVRFKNFHLDLVGFFPKSRSFIIPVEYSDLLTNLWKARQVDSEGEIARFSHVA